jgi:cytochrome o ubiquinol oxidase subunit 3
MNVAVAIDDVKQEAFAPASESGPAPKRIVVGFGFWIFLLSDIVMFSVLFATYAVLVRATAGGPAGAQLFNQVSVAIETACLLISSYTCGMMSLAVSARRRDQTRCLLETGVVAGADARHGVSNRSTKTRRKQS